MPQPTERMQVTPQERRRANVRLGLVLASIALAFLVGFVAKAMLFGA